MMVPKRITSLQHPRVQHGVRLRKDRAYREEHQSVVIVGKKMVEECPLPLQTLFVLEPSQLVAAEHLLVTESILTSLTALRQPDGVAAIVSMPKPQELCHTQFLLIADQISDPGNLGTLVRTALALGWGGIVATPGTVDFFNDKALRASKGAIFHLPFARKTAEEITSWHHTIFLANASGTPLHAIDAHPPLALILSHEAKGPSSWTQSFPKVSIPMSPAIDSLNVASAGAILLYAMRPS